MAKKEIETYCPSSRTEWRNWLKQHHQSKQSVWLIYYRVSTKVASITWSDAVDEALCHGWIDSTKKTIDEERYMQYFSKRKPKSNWSKVNKEKVVQLIEDKLMTKAGLESIEVAKENGSWIFLDDVENLVVPDDLRKALNRSDLAIQFFENLSNSNKKILLYWVLSAKRLDTRKNRIKEIALAASDGLRPKQFR